MASHDGIRIEDRPTGWTLKLAGSTSMPLHETGPASEGPAHSLLAPQAVSGLLDGYDGLVIRLGAVMVSRCAQLTEESRNVEEELGVLVTPMASALLAVHGVGLLIVAKLIRWAAEIHRVATKDAYARHNGTATLPAWSGNRTWRRLSRACNRQMNACLQWIAITQPLWQEVSCAKDSGQSLG